jgi:hypothetical protein
MERPTPAHWTRNLAKRLVPLLITGLMLLALVGLIQAAGYFGHKTNMSRTSDRRSAYPDIAANGTYVAVVWSEGYASGSPAYIKHYGPVYLRYTTDISKSFWSKIAVHNSNTASNNSRDPRIALVPGSPVAHIVWANHDESHGGIHVQFNRLLYKTCNLNNGSCAATPEVVANTTSDSVIFSSPDVAVDGSSGKAHVVWVRSEGGTNSVYYRRLDGSSPELVAPNASQPVIAVSNGYVHVAWLSGDQISYNRKRVGDDTWGTPITFSRLRSGNPAIDAINNIVYLVWDYRQEGTTDNYAIVYAFSTNNGSSWNEGGVSYDLPSRDTDPPEYRASPSDGNSSPGGGYSTGLQPDVTLAISGPNILAHVVWHQYRKITSGEDPTVEYFDIWYSSGNHSMGWTDPEINLTGDSHQHQRWTLEPVIAIGSDSHVHVAYMQTSQDAGTDETWLSDVYYDGYIEATNKFMYLPTIFKNQ